MQPLGDSQTIWNLTQNKDDSRPSDNQRDRRSRYNSLDTNFTSGEEVKASDSPTVLPVLPQAPTVRDGARDTFYSLCSLPRSSAVDSVIARLDFHPLAIELLASCVRENDWDEPALLKAWEDDQASVLKTSDHRRLMDAIEPALRSSTLGTTPLDMLRAIAASPCGIEESELEQEMVGTGEVVDVLCKFSLVYRQDGIVKMSTHARSYFLESAVVPAQPGQVLCCDVDYMPGAWLPTYNSGPASGARFYTIPRLGTPPGWNWVRGLPESPMKRLLAFLGRRAAPTTPVDLQDRTNAPPAVH